MNLDHFAEVLRREREKAGMTQKELAEKSGVTQRAISSWEQAIREPGWLAVVKLADALGISTEEFRKQPKKIEPPGKGRPRKAD